MGIKTEKEQVIDQIAHLPDGDVESVMDYIKSMRDRRGCEDSILRVAGCLSAEDIERELYEGVLQESVKPSFLIHGDGWLSDTERFFTTQTSRRITKTSQPLML